VAVERVPQVEGKQSGEVVMSLWEDGDGYQEDYGDTPLSAVLLMCLLCDCIAFVVILVLVGYFR